MQHPPNFIDRTGKIYGRLTVIGSAGFSKTLQKSMWNCECNCGKLCVVQGKLLGNGTTKSCGCLARENTGNASRTHGMSKTSEYDTFHRIRVRCYNKNCSDYPDYGGRGIRVCDRWLESFENFLKDMGRKPSSVHSIERINVNGNYEPSNCRWATPKEQAGNRRSTKLVTYRGESMTVTELARRNQLDHTTLARRLFLYSWDMERAVSTPMKSK